MKTNLKLFIKTVSFINKFYFTFSLVHKHIKNPIYHSFLVLYFSNTYVYHKQTIFMYNMIL